MKGIIYYRLLAKCHDHLHMIPQSQLSVHHGWQWIQEKVNDCDQEGTLNVVLLFCDHPWLPSSVAYLPWQDTVFPLMVPPHRAPTFHLYSRNTAIILHS